MYGFLASFAAEEARRRIAAVYFTKHTAFTEIHRRLSWELTTTGGECSDWLVNELISLHEALVKPDSRWETQSSFAILLTDLILLLTTPATDDASQDRRRMRSDLDGIASNTSIAEELLEGS